IEQLPRKERLVVVEKDRGLATVSHSKEVLMFTSKEHLDKPLISVTDGKKLGEIKDIYLDQDMHQMAAVHLGKEGLVNRRSLLIPRSAVQLFGVDTWLISGSDKVVDEEDSPEAGTFTLV